MTLASAWIYKEPLLNSLPKMEIAASEPSSVRPFTRRSEKGSDELFSSLVDSLSNDALFVLTLDGIITTWNTGAQTTFGYSSDEVVGKSFAIIFTAEDVGSGTPQMELTAAAGGKAAKYERWHVRKDGSQFWGTNTVVPMYDNGKLIGIGKLVTDTTESYRARGERLESEERLRLLIGSVPDYAIFSVEFDGRITTWNSAAHSTFGFTDNEIVGQHYSKLFREEDRAVGVPAILQQKVTALGGVDEERWFVRKDGSRFVGSEKISRLKAGSDGISRGFVHVAHDITERNHRAEELRRQASLDSLTKLPNREAFFEHVHRAIAAMKRRSTVLFAVMFIDLDNFKRINDTYGHIVADRLLDVTARRLESCVRTNDIVARIGGDEFAILLNGIADTADANDAGERISAQMAKPVKVGAHNVRATVSVGITLGSPRYTKPEEILHDADAAMYAAKARGGGHAIIFSNGVNEHTPVRRDLDADLRNAVQRGELKVAYQPVLRLDDFSICGFEALVRWHHPRHGLLFPRDFVAMAEESNLIIGIDRWVLLEACRKLADWRLQFERPDLTMSVNFSGKQFSQNDALDVLADALRQTGLPTRCLHLEITESAIMERSDGTRALLTAIRDLGIELQVDDFGVGYSSLAALAYMPVRALKMDRTFVAAMDSPKGAVLIRTITYLAQNLGMATIAEGIETVAQIGGLLAVGCEFGQGFIFSEPVDSVGAEKLLRQGSVVLDAFRSNAAMI